MDSKVSTTVLWRQLKCSPHNVYVRNRTRAHNHCLGAIDNYPDPSVEPPSGRNQGCNNSNENGGNGKGAGTMVYPSLPKSTHGGLRPCTRKLESKLGAASMCMCPSALRCKDKQVGTRDYSIVLCHLQNALQHLHLQDGSALLRHSTPQLPMGSVYWAV